MCGKVYRYLVGHSQAGVMLAALAWVGGHAWAGEIILLPPKGDTDKSAVEASRQKEKAKSYQKGETPALIVIPQEEGVVSPRKSLDAARSSERARQHLQEGAPAGVHIPTVPPPAASPDEHPSKADRSARQARKNRSSAIGYLEGKRPGIATDKDGLPLVDCQATDNVAGRIGEGGLSGSVVILIQDKKQIKARCR